MDSYINSIESRFAKKWLGKKVTFKMFGHSMTGEVIETKIHYLVTGIHYIVTVELFDPKQMKVSLNRQAVRIVE